MRLKYGNRIYEMADPVPGPDDVLVRVDEVFPIEYKKHVYHEVFTFNNPIRKVLFFTWREGVLFTFNKTKTSLLMKKILSERKVVAVKGYWDNKPVLAVGPQDCTNTDVMIFPRKFIAPLYDAGNVSRLIAFVVNQLKRDDELTHDLFYYSPFSGLEISFNLEEMLKRNPERASHSGEPKETAFQKVDLKENSPRKPVKSNSDNKTQGDLFMLGAGGYAYSHVLPHCRAFRMACIIDNHPILAAFVGERHRFDHIDNSAERGLTRLKDASKPVVIIATYHSSHLPLAAVALENNPESRIMIEKPPVTSKEQLMRLIELRKMQPMIEIGYNRRYAPFTHTAHRFLEQHDGPITVTCIVKEKHLPLEHWYYWPDEGSRITGNLSHWIDLGVGLIRKKPVFINAIGASSRVATDEPAVSVVFKDGSCLNLIASDRGSAMRGVQEYIDIRRGDLTIRIDDYTRMDVMCEGWRKRIYRRIRNKGHIAMYKQFVRNCLEGNNASYPNYDLIVSSRLFIDITNMLSDGRHGASVDYSPDLAMISD